MGSKKIILWSFVAVVLLAAVGVAVWLILDTPDDSAVITEISTNAEETTEIKTEVPEETATETISETVAETTTIPETTTEEVTTAPETTTVQETTTGKSEEEKYVEDFLGEANTYVPVEVTTKAPANKKPFFHVVTDGTVTDDSSLAGLEGAAKTIGQVILAAGFRYDKEQGIFYSETESWQRNFGFTALYDAGAAFTGMYYDTMRIKFNYDKRDWMFQIWKGRYGITTGAEMGVYYKDPNSEVEFYNCAKDEDEVTMSFALYKGDKLFMTRGPEPHWWLTGFKLFEMVSPKELTLHATFFMDDVGMANALEKSLKELGFKKDVNYQRLGLTMTIIWK